VKVGPRLQERLLSKIVGTIGAAELTREAVHQLQVRKSNRLEPETGGHKRVMARSRGRGPVNSQDLLQLDIRDSDAVAGHLAVH
jgi:hypothetical protein